MGIKIGIQLLAYECENTIEEVLSPWIKLKEKYDLLIWVASGQFKIYKDLGYENNNAKTLSLLNNLLEKGVIDHLFTTDDDNLLSDHETRDKCIPYFKENDVDLMIQLDSDEFYSEKDVENYVKFIEDNKEYSIYNTTFKNLVDDGKIYHNWNRFSAGWIKRHGGICKYYFDAHFYFCGDDNNTIEYRSVPSITIPKEIVNPTHDTWTINRSGSEFSDIKSKIEYQRRYYSHDCGWVFDEETGKIVPNKSVWGDKLPEFNKINNNKIVILSPVSSGKTKFMEKNNFTFNGLKLICNEYLSSSNNIINGVKMGSTSSIVPTGHALYKSWDDIYKIGLSIINNNDDYDNSCLIYNSTGHVSYIKEYFPNIELRIVLIDEKTHYNNIIDKWSNKKESNNLLIDVIKSDAGVLHYLNQSSWWYAHEERKIYTQLSQKHDVKIYKTFEDALK